MLEFERLKSWAGASLDVEYSDRDALLYALSVGLGGSQTQELPYVYEREQAAAPTLPMVVGHVLPWLRLPEHHIDMRWMLHGESELEIRKPLPVAACLSIQSRITHVVDRGEGKGAAIYFANQVSVKDTGELHAIVRGCFVFPRDGGPGDPASVVAAPRPAPFPEGPADLVVEQCVPETAAQLYRLNGDMNPLHIDPQVAEQAGQARPILHGLCTFGHAANALLRHRAGLDGRRVKRLSARYAGIFFPGETLRTEIFDIGAGQHAFRCTAVERSKLVINNGFALIEDIL